MAKNDTQNEPGVKPAQKSGLDPVRLTALGGIIALVVICFSIRQLIDQIQISLDSRLSKIEDRLAQLPGRVNPAAQQPQQRGPDPTRVYAINIADAPVKGLAGAPITIAEFSDFQ